MYSVYKIIAHILGYHTLSDGAQDMTVTRYIIAATRDDAIATCGAVIGQDIGEEGTFSSLKIVECSVVDTETTDLVAVHPQSLNPFVWDFEKGWCIPDKNNGTCARKDYLEAFVDFGLHVLWLK